jgi:2-polyprenyl-6-methoxyphenol hydroxylase-like FAD-dependent oxidoreductase
MQRLQLDEFSYWERRMYFEGIDFLVVGSGIVGLSTAIHLKKSHPTAKIVIVERGVLPSGASTKNAGFACFGSPTELLDDLKTIPETSVWKTVEKRWKGLQSLKELLGTSFSIEQHGSWE